MAENGSVVIKIKGDDSDFSSKLKGLGGAASTAMKAATAAATAAAATAAAAAAVAVGKAAVEAYADYEQLIGGVETLFKDSADQVQAYANNAFKTAGMSANAYMETVTSFSASLLQSLGGDTKAAAEMADLAVTDMADNANKMGTSMDGIVQTYQSLSRGNYAMLDNLKLGYGGTKAELERLIADAARLDESVDSNSMSFENIVKAIHAVQENMGIMGATAAEASETISGSVAAMKAAWQNMLVGIADENADFDTLLENLISSVGTAAENVLPRIKVVLEGIGRLVVELAPTLTSTAIGLLESLGQYLVDNVLVLLQRVPEIVTKLAGAFAENSSQLVAVAGKLIGQLGAGLIKSIPNLVANAPTIIISLVNALNDMSEALLLAGADIIEGIVMGMIDAIPRLAQAARDVCSQIIFSMKKALDIHSPSKIMKEEIGEMIGEGVAEGIEESGKDAVKAVEEISDDIIWEMKAMRDKLRGFSNLFEIEVTDKGDILQLGDIQADIDKLNEYREALMALQTAGVSEGLMGEITDMDMEDALSYMNELLSMTEEELDAYIALYEEKQKTAEEIAKQFYSLGSDTVEELQAVGTENVSEGAENQEPVLEETTQTLMKAMLAEAENFEKDFVDMGQMLMEGVAEGVRKGQSGVVNAIAAALKAAVRAAKKEMDINSPSRVMAEIGQYMAQGVGVGWTEQMASVSDTIGSSLSDGLESRMTNAYTRMRAAMDDGMYRLSGDMAVQAKGASNYTTNTTNNTEGDFVVNIEKIVNDGKGTVAGMMEEFEFIRRQKAVAKGGA